MGLHRKKNTNILRQLTIILAGLVVINILLWSAVIVRG